jgi:multisubunit Na+/H+ antiporter MnhF subunit
MTLLEAALAVLAVFILAVVLRVILGPTIWDRLLGLNMIASKILVAIIILARLLDLTYLLDIALVYAVLGFLGTVLIARFIERRGQI